MPSLSSPVSSSEPIPSCSSNQLALGDEAASALFVGETGDLGITTDNGGFSSKDMDNKFNVIFSMLKRINDVIGLNIHVNNEIFAMTTHKIIDGHGKAFEDVEEVYLSWFALGRVLCGLMFNIISYNVNVLNSFSKRKKLRKLVIKWRPSIFSIQKSNLNLCSEEIVKQI